MTNFEAAVELSLNNWVKSLPTEFDLPEPTEEYKKNIAKLFDKMRGDRYHKLTRSAVRAILIAAILLALATAVLAATVGREFIIEKLSDHSIYRVLDTSDIEHVDDIEIGYIPDGFECDTTEETSYSILYVYKKNDNWISIYKAKIDADIDFDTEYKNKEQVTITGIEGVYYQDDNLSYSGIVWNDGYYIYKVEGNILKEKLIKIAGSIK
ncbi:MAG: DUF4367 domain-containing protein [Ruminococcaceae bacterium]|nr:DUF4367 domain-containing protein [Oscillospiraceae bacterium]